MALFSVAIYLEGSFRNVFYKMRNYAVIFSPRKGIYNLRRKGDPRFTLLTQASSKVKTLRLGYAIHKYRFIFCTQLHCLLFRKFNQTIYGPFSISHKVLSSAAHSRRGPRKCSLLEMGIAIPRTKHIITCK